MKKMNLFLVALAMVSMAFVSCKSSAPAEEATTDTVVVEEAAAPAVDTAAVADTAAVVAE